MSKVVSALIVAAGLAAGMSIITSAPLSAHIVPAPCDFITGGGFIFTDLGAKTNFGAHGGANTVDSGGTSIT